MSEFDLLNAKEIIEGHGDWFGAKLLRLIAIGREKDRKILAKVWPKEVEVVNEIVPFGKSGRAFVEALYGISLKSDSANRSKLLSCALQKECDWDRWIITT